MTFRILSLISLSLLFACQKVCAQLAPADDFFNSGAQFYISNNIPAALERVEDGLKTYPDDEKLKKLEQLLKQQQNQQNQSQQQQQKNQQQQNQQKSQEQKKQAEQNKEEQQKQQEQQQQSSAQKKEAEKKQESQPVKPGEMTPEEAKRLLDAQKGDEQLLQWKPPEKPPNPSHSIKDW